MGLNCAIGMTKWTTLEMRGTWTMGYSWFMNDVRMSKGEWMPQPRATWVAFPEKKKKVINGDDKKLSKCWKQRLFTITK
jgi:hypothetical protein